MAADITAGERERCSLEPFLAQPIGPLELVFGKFLAVGAVCIVGVANSVFGALALLSVGRIGLAPQHLGHRGAAYDQLAGSALPASERAPSDNRALGQEFQRGSSLSHVLVVLACDARHVADRRPIGGGELVACGLGNGRDRSAAHVCGADRAAFCVDGWIGVRADSRAAGPMRWAAARRTHLGARLIESRNILTGKMIEAGHLEE